MSLSIGVANWTDDKRLNEHLAVWYYLNKYGFEIYELIENPRYSLALLLFKEEYSSILDSNSNYVRILYSRYLLYSYIGSQCSFPFDLKHTTLYEIH